MGKIYQTNEYQIPYKSSRNIIKIYHGTTLIWKYSPITSTDFIKYYVRNIYNSFKGPYVKLTPGDVAADYDQDLIYQTELDNSFINNYVYTPEYVNIIGYSINNISNEFKIISGISDQNYTPIVNLSPIYDEDATAAAYDQDLIYQTGLDSSFINNYVYTPDYVNIIGYSSINISDKFKTVFGISDQNYIPIISPSPIYDEDTTAADYDQDLIYQTELDKNFINDYAYTPEYVNIIGYSINNISNEFKTVSGISDQNYIPIVNLSPVYDEDTATADYDQDLIYQTGLVSNFINNYVYTPDYVNIIGYNSTNISRLFINAFGPAELDTHQEINSTNYNDSF